MFFNLVIIALVFFLVVKPLLRKLQQLAKEMPMLPARDAGGVFPLGDERMPELLPKRMAIQVDSLPGLRERALKLIKQDPNKARDILRAWLREV